jgi:hypothetical protein
MGGNGGWLVGLTTLTPSCADCREILGASTSWSPKVLLGPVMGQLYLYIRLLSTLSFCLSILFPFPSCRLPFFPPAHLHRSLSRVTTIHQFNKSDCDVNCFDRNSSSVMVTVWKIK